MLQFLLFACLLILSACSTSEPDPGLLLPGTPGPIDPTDAQLKSSIVTFLKTSNAPISSGYDFKRIDLNDDGRRDALVFIKSPYGYWCGMHGCMMLVFKAHDNTFELLNAVQPIREPVYVSDKKTRGWKNIIIRVSGRWDTAKNVALKYNGKSYPKDPSTLNRYREYFLDDPGYTRIFY